MRGTSLSDPTLETETVGALLLFQWVLVVSSILGADPGGTAQEGRLPVVIDLMTAGTAWTDSSVIQSLDDLRRAQFLDSTGSGVGEMIDIKTQNPFQPWLRYSNIQLLTAMYNYQLSLNLYFLLERITRSCDQSIQQRLGRYYPPSPVRPWIQYEQEVTLTLLPFIIYIILKKQKFSAKNFKFMKKCIIRFIKKFN